MFTGAVIMGIGSIMFMVPHFLGEDSASSAFDNKTADNICRVVSLRDQDIDLGRLGHGFSQLSNPALTPHNNLR